MRPVYATRLVIYSDGTHSERSLFGDVVSVCHGWLRHVASRYDVELPEAAHDDCSATNPVNGGHFSSEHFAVDGAKAWRALGMHPFESASISLLMRAELQVRSSGGGEVDVTIRLLLGSTYDSIRPVVFDIRPPRLVRSLLDAFPDLVSSGNIKAKKTVDYLTESDVADLCDKILMPNRLVPIIVISRLPDEQLPLDEKLIREIAADVAGLARVFVLPSFESAYTLTSVLSKSLSCYRGAVRIYWPGFTHNDSPFLHSLFTWERISGEKLQPTMRSILFDEIASASAMAIGSDTETWRMYRSHQARQQEAQTAALLDRMRESFRAFEEERELDRAAGHRISEATSALQDTALLRNAVDAPSEASWERLKHDLETAEELLNEVSIRLEQETSHKQEAEALLSDAFEEITKHDQTARELNEYATDLESKYAKTLAENDWLQQRITGMKNGTDVVSICSRMLTLRSVIEVVEFIQSISDENSLVLLPDAFESARKCSFAGDPYRVLAVLLRIQRVARLYHGGDSSGHKALFEADGETDYRANISETSRNEFRADYEKRYVRNGISESIILGPHIKLGDGSPTSSVSTYWYVDEIERKYVIGHIGRHLRGRRDT